MILALVAATAAGTWEIASARRVPDAPPAPTAEELAAYAALVRDLARAAPRGMLPADAGARADALGLALTTEGAVAWLAEPAGGARGVGVVALRLGALPGELVLQAPHPTSDLLTGKLTGALFDAGAARAACFAATHRDHRDAAHEPLGWMQAATDGLADALLAPLFVQVHGFAPDTSAADLVVSNGASWAPPDWLAGARDRLAEVLAVADARLGTEEPALAARTNVQGRLLAGRARFVHVEMALPVRRVLDGDAARRDALAAALLDLAAGEP